MITVSLQRREYDDVVNYISTKYNTVDLAEYVVSSLTPTDKEFEYNIGTVTIPNMTYSITLDEELTTGTYRLMFKLYDDGIYIGEAFEYIVIK